MASGLAGLNRTLQLRAEDFHAVVTGMCITSCI